ncbi:MAG: sigma-70 family RNA polymerase sigma factor [Flavonifractor plautii]
MAHQAGSAAGLERLMEEYGTGLLRLCALQLGDAALAEDAAQETLLRAWRRYGTFRGEAAERTWITAIALNVPDLLRSSWHTHRMELSALAEPAAEDAPWDDTPLRAVLSLPRKYREVVLLRYYEEFTLEEIADTLGIVPGTVSARLTRAKRKLRPMLEEWYYD